MDSARFIRSRSVLAAWLAVPALLLLIAEFGSSGFCEKSTGSYKRDVALQELIPRMMAELKTFDGFIKDYELSASAGRPIEDLHIALLNETAAAKNFAITALSVVQEPVGAAEQGVSRLSIKLKGFGSAAEVAAFFRSLKEQDPLIYESQVWLTRTVEGDDILQVEAELNKVYIPPVGKGERQ